MWSPCQHYLSSSEDESWQGDFEDDASSWASASERDALEKSIAAVEEAMKVGAIFSLTFHQHQMRASEDEDDGEQVVVSSKGFD